MPKQCKWEYEVCRQKTNVWNFHIRPNNALVWGTLSGHGFSTEEEATQAMKEVLKEAGNE